MATTTSKVKCPVCKTYEFSYANSYEICPVCNWENEEYQIKHPDDEEGPNGLSLNAYKAEWKKQKVAIAV